MAIRYAIDLTDAERTALREILSKNKVKRSTIINAYILLKADRSCGWTNTRVSKSGLQRSIFVPRIWTSLTSPLNISAS
jgi:hypothetical protein